MTAVPFARDLARRLEEAADAVEREVGRRLVEDEHAAVDVLELRERADDRHERAVDGGEVADQSRRARPRRRSARGRGGRARARAASGSASRTTSSNRSIRTFSMIVTPGSGRGPGGRSSGRAGASGRAARAATRRSPAIAQRAARVRVVVAGEDLDQRRLAGAVAADETVDLAALDRKPTSCSTRTPPKDFDRLSISMAGAVMSPWAPEGNGTGSWSAARPVEPYIRRMLELSAT